jgi:hypothetical protein
MKLRVENFGTLHPVIVNNLELYIIDLFSIAVSSTHHTTFITLVQLYDNTFQFVYGQIPEYIKQKHIKCVEGGDIDRTFSEQQFIPTKIRESLLELFLSFIKLLSLFSILPLLPLLLIGFDKVSSFFIFPILFILLDIFIFKFSIFKLLLH